MWLICSRQASHGYGNPASLKVIQPEWIKSWNSPPRSAWQDGSPDTDGWLFPGVTASHLVFHPALTSFPAGRTGSGKVKGEVRIFFFYLFLDKQSNAKLLLICWEVNKTFILTFNTCRNQLRLKVCNLWRRKPSVCASLLFLTLTLYNSFFAFMLVLLSLQS